jgi:pimeloyl-ACP methyl ester carboxylesterase
MPVQLIVGERDDRYRAIAERTQSLLPRADLAVVPQAGHTVHVDQPTGFIRVIKAALARTGRPAAKHARNTPRDR